MTDAAEWQEAGDDDLAAALRLIAERAGKEILAIYAEQEEITVKEKADKSPVTEADLAAEAGMTLVAFLRGSTMNAYAGRERITP